MDGKLWKELYRIIEEVGKSYPNHRVQHTHAMIVLVFLWAVGHDRSIAWACDPQHWSPALAHQSLPSPATMSRRLRTASVQDFLQQVLARCQQKLPASAWAYVDGKPLTVGGASHDPDAGFGLAAGGTKAKGYKMHVIWDAGGGVLAWEVHPMQASESVVARSLVSQLTTPGWLLADGNYDDDNLYVQAGEHGQQLLAGRRYPKAKGLGHRVQSSWRLRAMRMHQEGTAQPLLQARNRIERQYGALGNFAGGLGPLPNWVRRLPRVRRWVLGKLIFNALRIVQKKGLAA